MAPSTRTACFARVTAANFCFFLQGFVYPTLNAFTIDLAEPGQLGRTQTLYNGAFNLGTTAGSMALGPVAHAFGHPAMFLVAAGTAPPPPPAFASSARAATPRRPRARPRAGSPVARA